MSVEGIPPAQYDKLMKVAERFVRRYDANHDQQIGAAEKRDSRHARTVDSGPTQVSSWGNSLSFSQRSTLAADAITCDFFGKADTNTDSALQAKELVEAYLTAGDAAKDPTPRHFRAFLKDQTVEQTFSETRGFGGTLSQ